MVARSCGSAASDSARIRRTAGSSNAGASATIRGKEVGTPGVSSMAMIVSISNSSSNDRKISHWVAPWIMAALHPFFDFAHHVLAPRRNGVDLIQKNDAGALGRGLLEDLDRKSTRLNSSHLGISYAVFCLKKK